MKKFNEKHEAIIEVYISPIIEEGHKPLTGEVLPHSQRFQSAKIYHKVDKGDHYEVCEFLLGRELIIDLHDQSRQIEGEVTDHKYTPELPF